MGTSPTNAATGAETSEKPDERVRVWMKRSTRTRLSRHKISPENWDDTMNKLVDGYEEQLDEGL